MNQKTKEISKTEEFRSSNDYECQLGPLESLFYGNASARLLDFFSTRKEFDYSETDVAKHAGVSIRTTLREIPKFEQLGLIKFTRRVGRAKMYRLDPHSEASKSLQQLVYDISTRRNDIVIQNNDLQQKKLGEEIEIMESNAT